MKIIIAIYTIFVSSLAFSHGGGLDSCGGHNDRQNGDYHVHNYSAADACERSSVREPPPTPLVKKSKSGICHVSGSTYYARTKNFTAYRSLKNCLNSGGRLPKR